MEDTGKTDLIYACVGISPTREIQVGPLASWDEALAVEEVMRHRLAELVAAEDLIHEVNGRIVGYEVWDSIHDEVVREGRARLAGSSPASDSPTGRRTNS